MIELYQRICASCGKITTYKNKQGFNKAEVRKKLCRICSIKNSNIALHDSLHEDVKIRIFESYLNNKSLVEIAKQECIPKATVTKYLKKYHPDTKKSTNDYYTEETIKCVRCKLQVNKKFYQRGRLGKSNEYFYKYCNKCRNNQIRKRIYSSIDNYLKHVIENIKKRCKKDRINFNLDFKFVKDLYNNQEGKCFYTGIEMIYGLGQNLNMNQLSLDRIYFHKGYTKDNVVLCSNRINTIKSNVTIDELKSWMPFWYYKLKNSGYIN